MCSKSKADGFTSSVTSINYIKILIQGSLTVQESLVIFEVLSNYLFNRGNVWCRDLTRKMMFPEKRSINNETT